MTPEEFTVTGKRLFGRGPKGYGWQAEMHRRFDVPLRTIQAWASGENPIPGIVAGLLLTLDEKRNNRKKKPMRKFAILAASAALVSSPAHAVMLKSGMPSCISEELFMQMAHAVQDKDMEAITWLADNGCGISQKPLHVSLIDTDGALAHVRAYHGKHAVEVWTPLAALKGYDPLKD